MIGTDTVLAVNISPFLNLGALTLGGQFEDTLTVDLGFNGTPDSATRPSLHITFNGADELLPSDITSANDLLVLVSTDGAGGADLTPFTLNALTINSTEEVNIHGTRTDVIAGNIIVQGEMSVDVRATDAAQYSALIDLVHASSMATIDVLGGAINAGTVYLTAVATQIIDVGGFEIAGIQIGILNSVSDGRVSVEGTSTITSTVGGITLGASSAILAHNVLASNPGGDANTDFAAASTTIFTDSFAKVSGSAVLDSAKEVTISAGNSADSKAIADGSKGDSGATLGFSLILADTESSISGDAKVDAATAISVVSNANYGIEVLANATEGGAKKSDAKEINFDPSTAGVVDTTDDSVKLSSGHGLKDGDRVTIAPVTKTPGQIRGNRRTDERQGVLRQGRRKRAMKCSSTTRRRRPRPTGKTKGGPICCRPESATRIA